MITALVIIFLICVLLFMYNPRFNRFIVGLFEMIVDAIIDVVDSLRR